ncbi:MAG: hypothetical protein U9O87_02770 [Verrucomicrobiota bacterium]|nr:hypothetical protein [Verrucomicrobiota bacterium]
MNIIGIFGNNETRIKVEAQKAVEKAAGPNPDTFSLDIYAQNDKIDDVDLLKQCIIALRTPPFLGGKKTVWLKNFNAFDKEGTIKSTDPLTKRLHGLANMFAKKLPDDITFIVSGFGILKTKTFYRSCNENGKVSFFDAPKLTDKGWREKVSVLIKSGASERNIQLDSRAIYYVTEVIGTDIARINSELDKILCYKGENCYIMAEDLQDICVGEREAIFFAINTAFDKRDINFMLETLRRTVNNMKNPETEVIGTISSCIKYFKLLLQAKLFLRLTNSSPGRIPFVIQKLSDDEKKSYEVCSELINGHPFAAKFKALAAEKYTGPEIIEAIHLITEAYKKCVSSSVSKWLMFEELCMRIVI